MTMSAPTFEDRLAAWRLMGSVGPRPEEDPSGTRRWMNEDEQRRQMIGYPANVNSLRSMYVKSTSSTKLYLVEERADTVHGGTYVHCTCIAWPMMRGKNKDCRHVIEAVTRWSEMAAHADPLGSR